MRGRPRTPIGEWGDISLHRTTSGRWKAVTRYRDPDGKLRQVTATASSKALAKRRLHTKLASRHYSPDTAALAPTTTIQQLCEHYLTQKTTLSPQTLRTYHTCLSIHIAPRIGGLTLEETTPARIAAYLTSLPPSAHATSRSIMKPALDLAVSHGLIAANPISAIRRPTPTRRAIRALSLDEVHELRQGISDWQAGLIDDYGQPIANPTPRHCFNIVAFVDLLLATGCRPGELLAARWGDIQLDSTPATLRVNATMIRGVDGTQQRQEHTKTHTGRLLVLPDYAASLLSLMKHHAPVADDDTPVFATADGGYPSKNTVYRAFRLARTAAGRGDPSRFADVELRTMRRTVATLIDQTTTMDDAAAQLGHTSTTITRTHYIATQLRKAPDTRGALNVLFSNTDTSGESGISVD